MDFMVKKFVKPISRGQIQRGISVKEQNVESIKKIGQMINKIEEELTEDGINLFSNENVEEEFLQLPSNITDVAHKDLGRYLNAFTQQKMWVRTNLGRTKTLIRELNEELDYIKSVTYRELPVKMSVAEKELSIREHEEGSKLLKRRAYLQEKANILEDYLDNLVDGIFNISREISRRESDLRDEGREHSVGNKRRQ